MDGTHRLGSAGACECVSVCVGGVKRLWQAAGNRKLRYADWVRCHAAGLQLQRFPCALSPPPPRAHLLEPVSKMTVKRCGGVPRPM